VTDQSFDPGQEFAVHGGHRRSLNTWLLVTAFIIVASLIALVRALDADSRAGAGGVGTIFLPFAGVTLGLVVLAVLCGQWWEDSTYFRADERGLGVRHGTAKLRGRTAWLDRREPITVHGEVGRGTFILFVEQADARVRLGDSTALSPLQTSRLAAWLRAQGARVEHVWDGAR